MTQTRLVDNMSTMDTDLEHLLAIDQTSSPILGADGQPFPMIVWLRGDEDYCAEFSLDAEAVMEKLGIRRTRLTQISGRELRVGRIRRGRYIVPVYRPIDVTEYQQWTRATATHIKSSHVVQEAADSLRNLGEELVDRVDETVGQLTTSLEQSVRQGSLMSISMTLPLLQRLEQRFHMFEAHLGGFEKNLGIANSSRDKRLEQLAAEIDILRATMTLVSRDLAEVTGLTRLVIDESRSQHDELLEAMVRIEEAATPKEPLFMTRPLPSKSHARRLRSQCTSPRNGIDSTLSVIRRPRGRS
jgi:hypothetical protein